MKSFLKKYFDQGHQEGRREGRLEGELLLLLRLLRRRFGELPGWAEERLRQASSGMLETWSERVLTASTAGGGVFRGEGLSGRDTVQTFYYTQVCQIRKAWKHEVAGQAVKPSSP